MRSETRFSDTGPTLKVDNGFWVYDDKSTISAADKHVLEAPVDGTTRKPFPLVSKLARCWTGPCYVLIVGPGKAPDGDLVGRNLLLLDMRT